jgi:hypothetical protein
MIGHAEEAINDNVRACIDQMITKLKDLENNDKE